jgi:hypothetical protein
MWPYTGCCECCQRGCGGVHHGLDGSTVLGVTVCVCCVWVGAGVLGVWRCATFPSTPLQCAQAARKLLSSYQLPPHATGVMWSTVLAVVVQPSIPIWQVWLSRSSMRLRTVCHLPP